MTMIIGLVLAIVAALGSMFGWHKSVVAGVKKEADDKVKAAQVAATVQVATVEKAADKEVETVKGASDVQNEVVKLDNATVADKLRDGWTRG